MAFLTQATLFILIASVKGVAHTNDRPHLSDFARLDESFGSPPFRGALRNRRGGFVITKEDMPRTGVTNDGRHGPYRFAPPSRPSAMSPALRPPNSLMGLPTGRAWPIGRHLRHANHRSTS